MGTLRVLGFDPSLRNWGMAAGHYCMSTEQLEIKAVNVVCPELPTGKQVRQNSKDVVAAHQLAAAAFLNARDAQAIFIEIPVGSQSARAMASYGICVGILGSLRAQGIPFFEVTPTEVKMCSVGSKTASKNQMITWATNTHPEIVWPTYTVKGKTQITEGKAEHIADAVAAIRAGTQLPEFQRFIRLSA